MPQPKTTNPTPNQPELRQGILPRPDTMSAQESVLALPELLESILLHLPLKDLLFAQKVSRQWQTVIATSPPIQQALFFAPGQVKDAAVDATTIQAEDFPEDCAFPPGKVAINPLLCNRRELGRPIPSFYLHDCVVNATNRKYKEPFGEYWEPSYYKMYLAQPSESIITFYMEAKGLKKEKKERELIPVRQQSITEIEVEADVDHVVHDGEEEWEQTRGFFVRRLKPGPGLQEALVDKIKRTMACCDRSGQRVTSVMYEVGFETVCEE
jgi:hypothetical protein